MMWEWREPGKEDEVVGKYLVLRCLVFGLV